MKHFVARQPILDRNQKVYGYEILFRSSLENYFEHEDEDDATSQVIANTTFVFGLDTLAGTNKAFINFTRNFLVEMYATVLPAEQAVIEILENVEPDEEVIAACRTLREQGYIIALDDFVDRPGYEQLAAEANIIKVDFMQTSPEQRAHLAQKYSARGVRMLAEKIETHEDFEEACRLGYELFQGYFFSKPVVLTRTELPASKLGLIRILQEANRPEIDFERLSDMVQNEVSITYRLLRYVNSAALGTRAPITTVERAVRRLGSVEVRKMISLLALSVMADGKPQEVLTTSLIRAKFCEMCAISSGQSDRRSEYFLMGLFSLLDVIAEQPMEMLLDKLPLPDDIKRAVMGERNTPRAALDLILAFERGNWQMFPSLASATDVEEMELSDAYQASLDFARNVPSE